MLDLVAAIFNGTQATRAQLFDKNLQPVASHQLPINQVNPNPGWFEHDPLEIFSTVKECIMKALEEATEKLGEVNVRAIGIANQRETTVVWHKLTGMPLYNAIVWLDTRNRETCLQMEQELGGKEYFRSVTGLPISPCFSAFNYRWMYDNVEEVRAAADSDNLCFGTVDSWLIYQLTGGIQDGVHVTDVTNASRTMLMDLATCQWHEPFLELFHMPKSALPKIVSNAEVYGHVAMGPLTGVPIAGCLGDQMAALLGQRCVEGEAKNTYGTGCFMLLNTGPQIVPSQHGLMTTLSFKLGPEAQTQYALEGAVAVAGRGMMWLKDNMNMVDSLEELEALAKSVPDTGGVYFVPAFSGLMAPHWQDHARGILLGLTDDSTRAHVSRAMLEAICFRTREIVEAMCKDATISSLPLLRVDGDTSRNDLLIQLQADILQVRVLRPCFQDTTCLGAAIAAGLGIGFFTEEQVFASHGYNNVEFLPRASTEEADRRFGNWLRAVQRSMDLADLAP